MSVLDQIKQIDEGIKRLAIPNPEYMNYQQAASYLGCKVGTLRNMVCAGAFEPIKNGKFRYIRTGDLDEFIQGKRNNKVKN